MKEDSKSHPKSALDVLQGMLDKGNSPLAQDFRRFRLKLDWENVVGPRLSQSCSPVGFTQGILYIWVINSVWMNELLYGRKELIKKVNSYAGCKWVREVRFTQDKRDVPKDALSV